jgi:hypothetical protein
MAGVEGKGKFSRGDVSFGDCAYALDDGAREQSANGVVTILNTKLLPPFAEKKLGYLLVLDDGTRLGCELLEDLDSHRKGPGPTRRFKVRCWPKTS